MNLKELRLEIGLTQQECADYLKISRRTYQSLENSNETSSIKYSFYYNKLKDYYTLRSPEFNCNVILGNSLKSFYKSIQSYKKRYCYQYLYDYLHSSSDKLCILCGLRRTGKTTMIFQALNDIDLFKAVYIKVKESDDMSMLVKDINTLNDMGIKYYFIDEITLLSDFINSAAALSDIYCKLGLKIVLSGTDSLGFILADKDELYDRNIMIHTSYVSFKEFSYILDINDVDQYIEYGGTFKIENMSYSDFDYKNDEVAFKDDESTRKYIDTAISRNIQRSLKNNHFGTQFLALKELYDNNELTNVINRIINDMNHDFLISVITNPFKSTDLGSSKQLLLHQDNRVVQTALYDINNIEVINKMKDILDIKEKEETTIEITKEVLNQVKQYFIMLDLIKNVEVRYEDGHKENRIIFTQPGMRYAITKSLVHSLTNDQYFSSLDEVNKSIIIDKILSDVKGRMLEDIVLLESSLSLSELGIFKYMSYQNGEIDMVIYNAKNNKFDLYEVKHTNQISFDQQTKYLRNDSILANLTNIYGSVNSINVLYNGEKTHINGINYINVVNYLKTI